MGWQKLVMLWVNFGFAKQKVNQVLLILFTKLVNCTLVQIDFFYKLLKITDDICFQKVRR